MKQELIVILCIFLGFIILELLFTRFFKKEGQIPGDGIVELVGTLILTLITQPLNYGVGVYWHGSSRTRLSGYAQSMANLGRDWSIPNF